MQKQRGYNVILYNYYNYSYIQGVDTAGTCSEIDSHIQSLFNVILWVFYLFNLVQIYQKFLERSATEHNKTPAILELLFLHMDNLEIEARELLMKNGKVK